MKEVWVVAILRDGCDDPDEAAGVWSVSLDKDLEPGLAAGSALDIFHNKVAISEIDDFEISTIDPATREDISEPDGYVQQSGCLGSVELLADDLDDIE
jgi:hypothetical protein